MGKALLSVGLDVGTTSTQMILSRLTAENKASGFAVPQMQITKREILYRSPVYFTPLSAHDLVDGQALRELIETEYRSAGITRQQVDTGAVIITGETSRKENAKTVLESLSDFAGDFVVATAGPDLESILAARGAGALERSEDGPVLHMDIGGGTSNLCLCENGKVVATGCLNVGGRLLKFDETGMVTYRSPVLEGLTDLKPGDVPKDGQVEAICKILTCALEMAAGLREPTDLLPKLTTKETGKAWIPPKGAKISFSGGVADCIAQEFLPLRFGDMGPFLGSCIRRSRLCQGEYFLGQETIRATVVGAGCHSVALSGSTVFYQNLSFPLKNLTVAVIENPRTPREVTNALQTLDGEGILAIPGLCSPSYAQVVELAEILAEGFGDLPVRVCLQQDMAKALGYALQRYLPQGRSCLCIDSLVLTPGSYLDVGAPVGPAFPVVIKSLVFGGSQ